MKVQLQVGANVLVWDQCLVYVCLHFGNVTLEVCRNDNEQMKTCFWEIVILKTKIKESFFAFRPSALAASRAFFGKTFHDSSQRKDAIWRFFYRYSVSFKSTQVYSDLCQIHMSMIS